MKCLSIKQPWATLILQGGKDIENRSWMSRQRGTVLIHASKAMTIDEYEHAISFAAPMLRKTHEIDSEQFGATFNYEAQQRGGIVGMFDIVDCVKSSSSPWYMGDVGFVLVNPRPLPFTPYKGALGFFNVPDDVVLQLGLSS